MVALPLSTISPTVASIDAHYEAHQDVRFASKLKARTLADACERQGWYAFRWAHLPRRFTGSTIRANLGRDLAMAELGEALAATGVRVQRVDPLTFTAMKVEAADGHYVQRIAGTAEGILEAPKKLHLLYTDQQPAKVVAQIRKHGLAVARPDRIVALQVGMHLMGLSRAFYLVRDKDSDELLSERVDYDAAHALALMAKAERLKDASSPPARVSDDPSFWQCKGCPAHHQCHQGAFALRTCRTCLHSTPGAGGKWRCERLDRELSEDAQIAACSMHLYLPGLVAGEQVDSDDAKQTVTYRMAGGREWVDGKDAPGARGAP